MDDAMLAPFSRYTDRQMASIRLMRSMFCWLKDHPDKNVSAWSAFKQLVELGTVTPICPTFDSCLECPLGPQQLRCGSGHWTEFFNSSLRSESRVTHSTWIYNRLDAAYRHEVTLRRAERRKA